MTRLRRGDEVSGIQIENGTQVLFNGNPGVIVIANGTVGPVRLFVPRGIGGQWRDKWQDIEEAARQTENVLKYGYAATRSGTINTPPLQPNSDPETFIDYQAEIDAYAAIY